MTDRSRPTFSWSMRVGGGGGGSSSSRAGESLGDRHGGISSRNRSFINPLFMD